MVVIPSKFPFILSIFSWAQIFGDFRIPFSTIYIFLSPNFPCWEFWGVSFVLYLLMWILILSGDFFFFWPLELLLSAGQSLSQPVQQAHNLHPSLDFTHGHDSCSLFPVGPFGPSHNEEVKLQIVFCMDFLTDFCFSCLLLFFILNLEVSLFLMYKSYYIITVVKLL